MSDRNRPQSAGEVVKRSRSHRFQLAGFGLVPQNLVGEFVGSPSDLLRTIADLTEAGKISRVVWPLMGTFLSEQVGEAKLSQNVVAT